LSRVEFLTKQARELINGIRTDDRIGRIRGVCKNDLMGSVDNEGHEGERDSCSYKGAIGITYSVKCEYIRIFEEVV
jgi:hypothetical protein